MEQKTINVTRSSLPPLEEYIEEIRPLWDSHWLTNMGTKHRELEEALKRYLGTPYLTLFTNGHLALEAALAVFRFPAGGEVITTPFTFASTTHAIVRSGLRPVFCDIEPETCTMDPAKLEALITDRTVAILPVHVYGHLCDVEGIQAVADRHGLKVIYDAAHTFGVTRDGVAAVAFGDAAMLSFHATKVFHTIEGGAVCCWDGALSRSLDDAKNYGIRDQETVVYPGGNAKMSESQAAMGLCNLRHLDGQLAKRRRIVERYRKRLGAVPGLRLARPQPGVQENYAYFPVVFEEAQFGRTRDEVFAALAGKGINTRKYFYPLTCDFDCYRQKYGGTALPVARHIAQRILTLPLYADLDLADVDWICDALLQR